MPDIPIGTVIKTKADKQLVVGDKLGEGGQGAVYRVDYEGKPKALKWYSGKKFRDPAAFYSNLEQNIKKGKPTDAFLWPEDITNHYGPAFGYIMNLRPPEYKDFSLFLRGREGFASVSAMVNSSIQIAAGFRELHLKGYSYQDINDGNFFINPQNGRVLICDNDNVSEFGKSSGIMGKPRYMAPEIVRGDSVPNMKTDAYSLAVVLFLMWVRTHPLEGYSGTPTFMGAENVRRIYGTNPVFMFDPTDKSNLPIQGVHDHAVDIWNNMLPPYLREKFRAAFSKDSLTDPQKRVIELDWMRVFIRMRGETYKCKCDTVYFADPLSPNPCPGCGAKMTFPLVLKAGRYALPVHMRTKLFTCHIDKTSDDYATPAGEVVIAGQSLQLKNVSHTTWTIVDGSSTSQVPSGAAFPIKKGQQITFGGLGTATIA
ncbi:MAG: protein kinase [Polyangiaceae bacterium]|nr:protein kinase [Polyangiaceae bacterium]